MSTPTKSKQCKICKDTFLPNCPSQRICSKDHYSNCPICGKSIIWNSCRPVPACSAECKKQLTIRHNREKYGYDYPIQSKQVRDKRDKTMLDKYGTTVPLRCSDIKEKTMATNRRRFGTEWGLSNTEVRHKTENTMIQKYGGVTTLQCPELRNKVYSTMKDKYNEVIPMRIPEVMDRIQDTCITRYGATNPMSNSIVATKSARSRQTDRYTCISDIMNAVDSYPSVSQIVRADTARSLLHTSSVSTLSNRVDTTLSSIGVKYIQNYKIDELLYDYYCPDRNTVLCIHPNNIPITDPNRCLRQTQTAHKQNIRCIHIFEWDKVDRVVDVLRTPTVINIKDCQIYKISPEVGNTFLKNNHIQGTCRGQLLYLGLVYNDELYQVITFGTPRYNTNYDIELLRMCTKLGYVIPDGFSTLFKYAITSYDLNNIITYCTLSKEVENTYTDMGMELVRYTRPQEIWSKDSNKVTANLLRQRGYDQLFGTNYGKDSSNNLLMLKYGWVPVYDCGKVVFQYRSL